MKHTDQEPAIKDRLNEGFYISCDIPMAQFIINKKDSLSQEEKLKIHVLDNTHFFVSSDMGGLIKSDLAEFRKQHSFEPR